MCCHMEPPLPDQFTSTLGSVQCLAQGHCTATDIMGSNPEPLDQESDALYQVQVLVKQTLFGTQFTLCDK